MTIVEEYAQARDLILAQRQDNYIVRRVDVNPGSRYITLEETVQAANRRWYKRHETMVSQWTTNGFLTLSRGYCPTYGNCEKCLKCGPLSDPCEACTDGGFVSQPGMTYVPIVLGQERPYNRVVDALYLSVVFRTGCEVARADRKLSELQARDSNIFGPKVLSRDDLYSKLRDAQEREEDDNGDSNEWPSVRRNRERTDFFLIKDLFHRIEEQSIVENDDLSNDRMGYLNAYEGPS